MFILRRSFHQHILFPSLQLLWFATFLRLGKQVALRNHLDKRRCLLQGTQHKCYLFWVFGHSFQSNPQDWSKAPWQLVDEHLTRSPQYFPILKKRWILMILSSHTRNYTNWRFCLIISIDFKFNIYWWCWEACWLNCLRPEEPIPYFHYWYIID